MRTVGNLLGDLARKLRGIFGANTPTGFEAYEFDTAGPAKDEHPPVTAGDLVELDKGSFVGGWWTEARRFDINKGRLGGAIAPRCTVVHTTDMAPGTMAPLLKRWRDLAGEGAGAHFVIGKGSAGQQATIPTGGIVQLAPITRNGNHAGGAINGKPSHGNFKTKAGKLIHPNTIAVGIEIDNAGRLVRKGGVWVHKDSGKIMPDAQVYVDTHGRGYEVVTNYQLLALEALLDALDATMPALESGMTVVPNGGYAENGVPEASLPWCREVGHWTLDPYRKTDPGPQVDVFLEARARGNRGGPTTIPR